MRFHLIIISLGLTTPSYGQQQHLNRFKDWENSMAIPDRLINTMKSYNDDAVSRIASLKEERFMYEESPYYEQGYLFCEVIERYRKMVDIAKRSINFKSTTLFEAVKYMELIQKLYLEVYHLLNMMHEIPRKYENVPEFAKGMGEVLDLERLMKAQALMRERAEQFAKEQKRLKKFYKKMRADNLKTNNYGPTYINKPYNDLWPHDYGWEIQPDQAHYFGLTKKPNK